MHLFFFDYIYIFINKKNILLHNEIKIIINLNLKKMRKGILCLAAVAFLAIFSTSCKPDVVITAPDKIEIELGSTDADVLKGVEANTDDEVTVTGVNYDHAGEQTATFAAGDVTLEKAVGVKTTKLAGTYTYQISGDETIYDCIVKQSETVFNKIIVGNLLATAQMDGTAICQGSKVTIESFNLQLSDSTKAVVTGDGTFEKLESGIYQLKDIKVNVDYEEGNDEVFDITFKKE
jgi:hypothetical protein